MGHNSQMEFYSDFEVDYSYALLIGASWFIPTFMSFLIFFSFDEVI